MAVNARRLSVKKLSLKNQLVFVKNHLLKLMFNYWFIYLIFVPMGVFFGRPFWEVYQGNILYGIMDFMGLSYLFSMPSMNATWWFMSIIIVLYLLFPLFIKIMDYSAELWLVICILINFASFFPELRQLRRWLLPFALGMYLSKYNVFDKIGCLNLGKIKRWLLSGAAVISQLIIRYLFYQDATFDAFLAVAITLFCFIVLSNIPIISTVMEKLGRLSGLIFMFHTFIFSFYFKDLIYWFKYAPVIFIVMISVCFVFSMVIVQLKKLVRYDCLINKLTETCIN